MHKLKIAVAGCGFWANYQVAAWKEFDDVEIVAACDKEINKAREFQKRFDIGQAFGDIETMLKVAKPDVLEVISSSDTHALAVRLAAENNTTVICQKPLTPTWRESKQVVELCKRKGVALYVHENWRFQQPMRKVKHLIDKAVVGDIFRARITCSHAFPIFDNQPFLKEVDQMVIADLGVHLIDTARYFFGEADYLYARVSRITPGVKGEDVATIMITFKNGCCCLVELSVATRQEIPHFPQTLVHLEGSKGVISLKEQYRISVITDAGVEIIDAAPRHFPWLNPDYAVVHSSIYDCNSSILNAITGRGSGETTGVDNLETLRLTYASYASAKENKVIYVKDFK